MTQLPYKKILNQALEIVKKHKELTVLSLLFGFAGSAQILIDPKASTANFNIFALVALGILGILLIIYLGGIARGAIISEVLHLDDKKSVDIKRALKSGWNYSWQIFGLNIATLVTVVLACAVLFVPIWNLWRMNLDAQTVAMTILAVAIIVPLVVIAGMVNILASNFLVSANMPLTQAIRAGFDLFFARWRTILKFFLLLMILTILVNIVFEMVISIFGISEIKIIFALLALAFNSFVTAWQSVAWVLAWQNMVGQEKSEKIEFSEESEALPEIVS